MGSMTADASPMVELGSDRYVIRRRLGEGAFGVVYEAEDRERDTVVALKVLRRADGANLYRFKQEFRRIAQVSQHNLVTLHELHGQDDRWFFTMELVNGVDFVSYVRGAEHYGADEDPSARATSDLRATSEPQPHTVLVTQVSATDEPLPLSDPTTSGRTEFLRKTFGTKGITPEQEGRLRLALAQLTQGLEALHGEAMLHRDVKPSNVMVDLNGRVVLLDFGLVTDSEDSVDARLVGTPAYMSPEQATGATAHEATDWYAVGVLLYETLTGRLPFDGNAREILSEKLLSAPPDPRAIHPNVPADLAELAMKLMIVAPKDRASGADILTSLREHSTRPTRTGRKVFVGRESERAALEEAFENARNKQLSVAILRGKSGTGKSTIARRFIDQIREEYPRAVVLAGQCYEQETVPFEALDSVVDALTQYLVGLDRDSVESLIPSSIAALASIFPVLRRVDSIAMACASTELPQDPVELRTLATNALAAVLRAIAVHTPLVLFVDNLHWGDADSTSVLDVLLRSTILRSVFFLATVRTEDGDPVGPARLFTAQNAERSGYILTDLSIDTLGEEDAYRIALAQMGDATPEQRQRARIVASESGGNPYFIDVLARHAKDSRDDDEGRKSRNDLDEVLWNSARKLDRASLDLLEVVAVAGTPLSFRVLRRAAGLGVDAATALARLRSNRFVRVRRSGTTELLECHHDRVREAISSRLELTVRRSRHSALARVLSEDSHTDPDVLAQHYEGAAEYAEAEHFTTLAAERAFAALAFDRAARLFLHASELSQRLGLTQSGLLLERAGDSLANAGRGKEAARQYLLAAQYAPELKALRLRLAAADPLLRSGHIDEGVEQLRLVLAGLNIRYPESPQRALAALLWTRAKLALRGEHYTPRPERELSARQVLATDATRAAAQGLALVDNIRGAAFNAIHYLDALELGEPYRVARASAIEVGFYSTNGSSARARTAASVKQAIVRANACDNPHALGLTWMIRGVAGCMEGRFLDSVRDSEVAIEILRDRCVSPWDLAQAQFYSLASRTWLGEYSTIAERTAIQIEHSEARGDLFATTGLVTYLAFQPVLVAGKVGEARQMVHDAIGRWSKKGFHVQHWWALKAQANCDLFEGDGERALQRLQSRWTELEQSLLLRVQYAKIEALHLRGRARVSAASSLRGSARVSMLRDAEKDARALQGERVAWADGLGSLMLASIAAQSNNNSMMVENLVRAERKLCASDLRVHAAVARYLRAKFERSSESESSMARAQSAVLECGARSIDDMVNWLACSRW